MENEVSGMFATATRTGNTNENIMAGVERDNRDCGAQSVRKKQLWFGIATATTGNNNNANGIANGTETLPCMEAPPPVIEATGKNGTEQQRRLLLLYRQKTRTVEQEEKNGRIKKEEGNKKESDGNNGN